MGGEEEKKSKPKKTFRQKTAEGCRSFGRFMWNSEQRTCMGRTGISWLQILSFYVCFYAVIAGIWAICMAAFLASLDKNAPTQTFYYSMLKNNPGMGQWPTNDTSGTIVKVNTQDPDTYSQYFEQLDGAFSSYNNSYPDPDLFQNCESTNQTANLSVACQFDMSQLGAQCSNHTKYGYTTGKPCVLLRINKIYGWDPHPLFDGGNTTNEFAFSQIANNMKTTTTLDKNNKHIPISCVGETDADKDNINSITFYPSDGISSVYFPFYNQLGYQPPAVMAQFDVTPGVLVMVWCQFWTKNVIFDHSDLQGSVHVEVYVMNNITALDL